jgi:hypothetical protein
MKPSSPRNDHHIKTSTNHEDALRHLMRESGDNSILKGGIATSENPTSSMPLRNNKNLDHQYLGEVKRVAGNQMVCRLISYFFLCQFPGSQGDKSGFFFVLTLLVPFLIFVFLPYSRNAWRPRTTPPHTLHLFKTLHQLAPYNGTLRILLTLLQSSKVSP